MPENHPTPIIEVTNLTKHYHRLIAVDHITFTMHQGEAFGFLGPNGAGKSTVVKMLTSLVAPTAGTIRILGHPINHMPTRRRIGYLPELPTFHRWLKAREFLDFHGRLYGLHGAGLRKRSLEVLAAVGLSGRENQKLGTFSKGMLQRIGLAQALLNQPDLLILDELVSGLDPVGVRDMRDLLRQLKASGISIFLNSHQLADVEALCDRVAIINQGRILKIGAPATLFEGTTTLEVRVNQVTPDLLRRLQTVALTIHQPTTHTPTASHTPSTLLIEVEQEEQAAAIATIIHTCGLKLYTLAPQHHTLEQLFFATIDATRTGDPS